MMPAKGFMLYVTGKKRAMVMGTFKPGIAPIKIPTRSPIDIKKKFEMLKKRAADGPRYSNIKTILSAGKCGIFF